LDTNVDRLEGLFSVMAAVHEDRSTAEVAASVQVRSPPHFGCFARGTRFRSRGAGRPQSLPDDRTILKAVIRIDAGQRATCSTSHGGALCRCCVSAWNKDAELVAAKNGLLVSTLEVEKLKAQIGRLRRLSTALWN
jgi:hypothetical protein